MSPAYENPDWLLELPVMPRTYELAGIAENCRLQWQSARRHIADRGAADEAFRAWLLHQTRAQLVASRDAAREADRCVRRHHRSLARQPA